MAIKFKRREIRDIGRLEHQFEVLAFFLFRDGARPPKSINKRNRRIISWIGATPEMLARLWILLERGFGGVMPRGATKERLLWSLHLLKCYNTDEENAGRFGGVDEKTFAYWA